MGLASFRGRGALGTILRYPGILAHRAGAQRVSKGPGTIRHGQAKSKRSRFITLDQAAAKSFANFSFESLHA